MRYVGVQEDFKRRSQNDREKSHHGQPSTKAGRHGRNPRRKGSSSGVLAINARTQKLEDETSYNRKWKKDTTSPRIEAGCVGT
ncbi:hypothetical protein NDU88_001856 [Pleurodeles waltl]|uniref:Uncharacterized protein n=1 Tax=Pleurodeles waltl TaxID=8319 RepID=A0AAV7W0G0_PLEWA|nr:hypothetical protein NDU88_001856 [Pleurodeles waltl]